MAAPSGKRKDSARRKREELEDARRGARRGSSAVTTDLGDVDPGPKPLSPVYKAVMFGLMIVGLLWIVVYYVAGDRIPFVATLNAWNFAIGFGLMVAGLVMSMRWR